jgi:Fe-S cluster assembly protein SufD
VSHDDTAIDLHVVTLYGEWWSAQIDGKVALMPWGVKMHGELLEENIILGSQATIKTLPMLDVHTSEVTAWHGARIERLDNKKLFYLKSRGLDEQQATHMMIGGYIESIFEWVEETPEVEQLKAHAFTTILESL